MNVGFMGEIRGEDFSGTWHGFQYGICTLIYDMDLVVWEIFLFGTS